MEVLTHVSNMDSKAYVLCKGIYNPSKLGTTKSFGDAFWGPGNFQFEVLGFVGS